jgi:RND family efflux transporter MFP subunit
MNKPFRFTSIILALSVLLASLLSGCSALTNLQAGNDPPVTADEEPTPTPLPTPIVPVKPTYKVQLGDVVRKVEFAGRVVPSSDTELYFRANGRIKNVYVKRGDLVKAGQLLADLETDNNAFALRRAEIYLEMAKISLEMTKTENPPYRKESAWIIALQEKDVELAQIGLDELKDTIASTQIITPIDGTVMQISVTDGGVGEAFMTAFVVADLTKLEISSDPTSEQLNQLEEGMTLTAEPSSSPGQTYAGVIRRLPYPYGKGATTESSTGSEQEKKDQSTRITLEKDPLQAGLSVGDLLTITVIIEQKTNVLWLPPQAVRKYEGRRFVIIQEESGQRRVDVKVGISNDERLEVTEGISEGMIVVAP